MSDQDTNNYDVKIQDGVGGINVRIDNNVIDLTIDEDFITDDFVADLINQKFDLFTEHNEISMLYEGEDSGDDYFMDTKYMILEEFERELAEGTRLAHRNNELNEEDPVFYGPHPLAIEALPTCSKFENSKNTFTPVQKLNNKISSDEEFIVDMSYPNELSKSNNNDSKVFNSLLCEHFKLDDVDSTHRKLKLKSIINDQLKLLINIANNYLDINRMYLEHKMRKTRRNFQNYISKLIDENYHIAYNETEFTCIIEKTLLEDIQKMKKQVEKKIYQEKCNVRETFFKTMTTQTKYLEKNFNFVQFLYSLTTLLENKIEIVNCFIRDSMNQLATGLHKYVKNIIHNRVVLPKNHDKWTPGLGGYILPKNKVPTVYNETLTINNNFHDTRDLLLNFENFPTKTADFRLSSIVKHRNKEMQRIYDEVKINDDDSGLEEEDALNFLKSQIKIFRDYENIRDVDPSSFVNTKFHKPIANKKDSIIETKNNAIMVTANINNTKVSKIKMGVHTTPSIHENRKIMKAKRQKSKKLNNETSKDTRSTGKTEVSETAKRTSDGLSKTIANIEQIAPLRVETSPRVSKTEDSDFTSRTHVDFPKLSAINVVIPALDFNSRYYERDPPIIIESEVTTPNNNDDTSPGTSRSAGLSNIAEISVSQVRLHDYELLLLGQINDDTTRQNILKDIDRKLKELNQSLFKTYQDIAIIQYEYQKIGKYKEELTTKLSKYE